VGLGRLGRRPVGTIVSDEHILGHLCIYINPVVRKRAVLVGVDLEIRCCEAEEAGGGRDEAELRHDGDGSR
jgi:hypothetical protein